MSDDPNLRRALDRRLPLEERRQAYRAYAESTALLHVHPRPGARHSHLGGDDPYHTHQEIPR